MNAELRKYLENIKKKELKFMYSYDIDDCAFGIETDKYKWCNNATNGNVSIERMIEYFEKYYSRDEEVFIKSIKELLSN